jgi:hypothetical protein
MMTIPRGLDIEVFVRMMRTFLFAHRRCHEAQNNPLDGAP